MKAHMTPMQTLKNNFLSLREKLYQFEEINLNKSQPKDIVVQNVDDEYLLCFSEEETNFSHYTKKGVKSDFIKIFKVKTKKEKNSVAFHFEYLNISEPKIQCSIKNGDDFYITDAMNLQEFKEKLNSLNNTIKNHDIPEIIDIIKETFFTAPQKTNKLKI